MGGNDACMAEAMSVWGDDMSRRGVAEQVFAVIYLGIGLVIACGLLAIFVVIAIEIAIRP